MTTPLADAGLLAGLAPVLATAWDVASVEIVSAEALSAGASRLSWALDVVAGPELHRLVVQRERVPGNGRSNVSAEARLLRAAAAAGVPVPRVVAAGTDPGVIGGAFTVTTRVDGETIPRRILRLPELAQARACFADQCGQILAAIHAIPVDAVAPLPEADTLASTEEFLDATGDPRPAFELGLRWLRDNRPEPRRPAVVHGDFRNGNLIVGSEGIRAVLDWELAHIGDPLEDLGWLCARAWRWGERPVVGGLGSRAKLLAAYNRAGGDCPTAREIFWWQLLATVRWGVMCLEQARTHLSGETRSVELAVIGRRACEMEYDVLRMLA